MASSSSDPSSSSTEISNIDIYSVCQKYYDQRWRFNQHYMFMDDHVFFQLIQCGLVDKIANVFQIEDEKTKKLTTSNRQKRHHEDIDDNDDTKSKFLHREELVGTNTKRTKMDLMDASTQTDHSLLMNSSNPSSSDAVPSSSSTTITAATTTTTTVGQIGDVSVALEKRRYQTLLLHLHHFCLRQADMSLLDHHQLLDPLVQQIEDIDRIRKTNYSQTIRNEDATKSHIVPEKHCNSEEIQEDEESDADDWYDDPVFDLSTDIETDDEEDKPTENMNNTTKKEFEEQKLDCIDAST